MLLFIMGSCVYPMTTSVFTVSTLSYMYIMKMNNIINIKYEAVLFA